MTKPNATLPVIFNSPYDAKTPGRACAGCNSAWPAAEGDDEPTHHDYTCPWWDELFARNAELEAYHQHTAGVCNLLVCPRDGR